MKLKVIGFGLGRTGTYSSKIALEELGLGPCHHMERVGKNMPVQLPLWNEALNNQPNFEVIYEGMQSAFNWPYGYWPPRCRNVRFRQHLKPVRTTVK
ncbi:MAG: hypothetical protein ACJAWN_001911 [Neolewinella sp.]|jgi:hypothetical protein